MAKETVEKKKVTNLDQVDNPKEVEYDLVTGLLEAASYKTSEDSITEVEIKRAGKLLFKVNIHPVSETDVRTARKNATTYMANPNNKKLPKIPKEENPVLFKSWLIYLGTTEEDQKKVWGNPVIMSKFGLLQPVESIDILLTAGEKDRLFDELSKITDMDGLDEDEQGDDDDETMDEVEYAKN